MSISIRPLRGAFAGEVSRLDTTKPIDREAVAAIEAGMDAYAVLVFRDQHLTDEQQIAFTLNFGELESYKTYSHAWNPGDLVMWDNRATMHRARRFDHSEVRDVRRTTLAGTPPIV